MAFEILLKRNSEYTKVERFFVALFALFVFGIIGVLIRLLVGPVSADSWLSLVWQFGPVGLAFGIAASLLAYKYPKPFSIFMTLIPGIGT